MATSKVDASAEEIANGVRYFLVSWDNLGVEYLEDITKYHPNEWAKLNLLQSIKDGTSMPPNPLSERVTHLTLRARFNNHRHYEIYVFSATEGVEFDDIKKWSDEDPQGFANFVRENHALKIFDDRAKPDKYKII